MAGRCPTRKYCYGEGCKTCRAVDLGMSYLDRRWLTVTGPIRTMSFDRHVNRYTGEVLYTQLGNRKVYTEAGAIRLATYENDPHMAVDVLSRVIIERLGAENLRGEVSVSYGTQDTREIV